MGKLITVCGAACSIPSAVFAANLAIALSAHANQRILLMASPLSDSDEWGILLHQSPEKSLDDLIALHPSLNAALLAGFLSKYTGSITLLGSSHCDTLDATIFSGVLTSLIEAHDWVVLPLCDFAPCAIADTILAASAHIVIPVQSDLLYTQYAASFAQRLSRRHIDARSCMFAAVDCGGSGQLSVEQIEKILESRVYARIPCDSSALSDAVAKGLPQVKGQPASPFARSIADWVKTIIEKSSMESTNRPLAEADSANDRHAIIALKRTIHAALVNELKNTPVDIAPAVLRNRARDIIAEKLSTLDHCLSRDARPQFIDEVLDEALGLGCLEEYLKDPSVTEIMVNGPDNVYIEIKGRIRRTVAQFTSVSQLLTVIDRIVAPIGRRVDETSPLVDARLPDGSRVNAVIAPISLTGPVLTIRKFSQRTLSIDDLIAFDALSPAMAEYLRICVRLRKNIVISGGTGSGKTTLLNVISSFIPADERIVTIEDSAELNLPQNHVVRLEARPPSMEGKGDISIRRLVVNALRMRPDRIIVGECRGGETLDMLQAMNTGHDGSLTTLHANTPRDAVARLTTMVIMAGTELPERAIREQIVAAIQVIIQLSRMPDGSRKIVAITEVRGLDSDGINQMPIFSYERTGIHEGKTTGRFIASGNMSSFIDEAAVYGLPMEATLFSSGGKA